MNTKIRRLLALLLAALMVLSVAVAEDTQAQNGGTPPEMPENGGTPPEMPANGGTPPERPADGGAAPADGGTPPAKPDGGMGDAPGGFGGSGEITQGTAATTLLETASVSGETFTSSGDNENALRVTGDVDVTLRDIVVEKTGGATDNSEDSDFYGQNAGLLATDGANVVISGATVTTNAVGGNAVFSYGEGTVVTIEDSVIRTSMSNSGGIHVTGGGTLAAHNLDVETQGNSAAAIRSDRGGGTLTADGGTYVTNGTGSPAIYCTADITVSNATLTANHSEGVVVEGKNSVNLIDCDVSGNMDGTYGTDSGENIQTIMIYQSMSGDADVGQSHFGMTGGSLTSLQGDLIYVTNTACTIDLSNVSLTLANENLLKVVGNENSRGWGKQGENGGQCTLTADAQNLVGVITVDSISTLDMRMQNGSTFEGTINPDGQGGTVNVTLEEGSTWTLTADAYVTTFTGDMESVNQNGFTLYVAQAE